MLARIARLVGVVAAVVVGSLCFTAIAETPASLAPATQPTDLAKIATWKGAAPNSAQSFTFAIISDRTGGMVPGRWEQAIREINLLHPDFVMSVGDLLSISSGPEDTPAWRNEFPNFPQLRQDVDDLIHSFDPPFFICPGNHDISNDTTLKAYLERYGVAGKTYYSFDYRDCHFVVLDSMTPQRKAGFAAEQAEWFAQDMARAASAKHIFLFWHHPLWTNAKLWKPLRDHIDPAKTTIFNGHTHTLSYGIDCDVPTYILASTGAGAGEQGRAFGILNMFAVVSVDQGKPAVAMLPLGATMNRDYAIFATKAVKLLVDTSAVIPAEGGEHHLPLTNPLDVPVAVSIAAQGAGWSIEPSQTKLDLAPGKSADLSFAIKPVKSLNASAERPKIEVTYNFIDPANQKVQSKQTINFSQYRLMDAARAGTIAIDGSLDDWGKWGILAVDSPISILQQKPEKSWRGRDDGSYSLRLAHDDQRLYLGVEVRDDQIVPGPASPCDTLAILWDVRPPDQADGKMDERTGYMVLHLPVADEPASIDFPPQPGKPLKDLKAVSRRTEGGYVFEIAMPLDEMGLKTPVQAGQQIRLEVQLADQDKDKSTLMNSSGTVGPTRSSAGYIRCTLR